MTYQIVDNLREERGMIASPKDCLEAAAIIEELAAALKPFAELADWFERNLSSEELVLMNYYLASCRAREALCKLKGE